MSIAGIDFGNLSSLIACTSKGGIDVILNESSNRQTASCVSIQGKQRFIGDAGASMARSNVKNTLTMMKLFVGRGFDEPEVQAELAKAPFKSVKMPHGGVGIEVMYNDESTVVSAEHVMAMMMQKLKDTAFATNNGVAMADTVMAVPYWFTESQRRAVLIACEIAQLHCLKVVNEPTAVALSYGIYKSAKKLFSETEPMHVMFVDIGYTGYTVTIVDFIQEKLRVLATVCDTHIGGRDMDDIIINYCVEQFQQKTGIDVRNNKKALLKLQVAAEKAKKTLSPNGVAEASISVECLAEERDLAVKLTREEFESRLGPLVSRIRAPVEECLAEAGLAKADLAEVEVVGGATRVNIVKRTLGEVLELDAAALNYGLKTTMNADEAVARGCALQCAMESSRVKVKPFSILDRVGCTICAQFDEDNGSGCVELYARGDDFPRKPKRLTFKNKTTNFPIHIAYDNASADKYLVPGTDRRISTFMVMIEGVAAASNTGADAPQATQGPHDVRVTFTMDKNGSVVVAKGELMIELEPVAVVEEVKSEEKAVEAETKEEGKEEGKDMEVTDGGGTLTDGVPAAPKRRFRKVDLAVSISNSSLPVQQIKEAIELEANMANEDRIIMETTDKRNELEAYTYSMRDKLDASLKKYGTESEKTVLKQLLEDASEWLYGDGFDATKKEYTAKLDACTKRGNAIEKRLNDELARPAAVDGIKKQIENCRVFTTAFDADHEHITDADRSAVRKIADTTESWLFDMQSKQGDKRKDQDSCLTVDAINIKRKELFNIAQPIMTKPKPKPVFVPTPAPTPAPTPDAAPAATPETAPEATDASADTAMGVDETAADADAAPEGETTAEGAAPSEEKTTESV